MPSTTPRSTSIPSCLGRSDAVHGLPIVPPRALSPTCPTFHCFSPGSAAVTPCLPSACRSRSYEGAPLPRSPHCRPRSSPLKPPVSENERSSAVQTHATEGFSGEDDNERWRCIARKTNSAPDAPVSENERGWVGAGSSTLGDG
jgi:hypothetical protein